MNMQEVMRQLEAAGTAQNRKVYARHGVDDDMFGVSWANLGKLRKQIKTDQPLAEALWQTGNNDAQVLATMVADPAQLGARALDQWAKQLDNYVLADALAGLVGKSPHAHQKAERWMRSKDEWVARAGWSLLGQLALHDDELPDDYFADKLREIAASIHGKPNRVREAMNSAVIAIGTRNTALRQQALAAARQIGAVEVDHGETNCKTPDAVAYIQRTWQRKRARPHRR